MEETRAALSAGIEMAKKNNKEFVEMSVVEFKKSKKAENPSSFIFTRVLLDKTVIKANDVFLLESPLKSSLVRLLALASFTPTEEMNRVTLKVVVNQLYLSNYSALFDKHAKWQAKPIGSLVTHLRMYDVCSAQPNVVWFNELLSGRLRQIDPVFGLQHPLPAVLNASQNSAVQKFMDLNHGLQLVQGPPGTGKSAMINALLNLLISRGRALVCAPSNKAVHVLASRFVIEHPKVPVVLVGVEDKLPKENHNLQEIFLHTWGELKLRLIVQIKNILWELSPDSLFMGSENEINNNVKTVPKKIDLAKTIFFNLIKDFEKYKLSLFQKEAHDIFNSKVKELVELLNFDTQFNRSLTDALKDLKKIDQKNIQLLEVKFGSLFKKIKLILSELLQILTQTEVTLSKNNLDDSSSGLEAHLLNQSQIIFATLSVSGRRFLKEMDKIEFLIIDEAGQALEAECLIPLVCNPKKCLLVGDTKQLPATVISPLATKLNFGRSLMGRLIEECGVVPTLLNTQYRMHAEIRKWPSQQFYGGKLEDGKLIAERQLSTDIKKISKILFPYCFINISGHETSSGHSFENAEEANFVAEIVYYLQQKYQMKPSQIGIITFYKGQTILIQRKLSEFSSNIKVQTVDSFQGDENDIIIISFVRANFQRLRRVCKRF